jgi:hypothetical protein
VPVIFIIRITITVSDWPFSFMRSRRSSATNFALMTDKYFKALSVAIIMGRPFTNQDGATAPRVIILNESASRAPLPRQSPLGKLVHGHFASLVPFWRAVRIDPVNAIRTSE